MSTTQELTDMSDPSTIKAATTAQTLPRYSATFDPHTLAEIRWRDTARNAEPM
jgi:hypothetical protein